MKCMKIWNNKLSALFENTPALKEKKVEREGYQKQLGKMFVVVEAE